MKLEKKHWIIIGVVVAIIAVWYFFLRKKKTESSYDPNLLIFGDSSYDPAFPELGESGFRVSPKVQLVRLPNGGILAKQNGNCPCGDKNEKGICIKDKGMISCRAGTVVIKDEDTATSSFKGVRTPMFAGGGSAERSTPRSRCANSGGDWVDCWNEDTKTWVKCCAAKASSAL